MIKLTDLLENDILKPRRSPEERQKNYKIAIQKRIQKYIKDGGKGSLDLRGSPVEKLPDNLQVGGDLFLENTPIRELSDNLQVGGGLFLHNTSIKELPNNLKVGRNLLLGNTPLSKKYSIGEIRSMIEEKGGYVKRTIMI